MCFSAQASFIASGTLLALGSYALKKASNKNLIPLALIPIFFGIQQASEGVVWLTYGDSSMALLNQIASWLFLFFAYFFWPIWIPFTALSFEKKMKRKHILFVLFGMGVTVATTLIYTVVTLGVTPEINCSHIHYNVPMPALFNYWGPLLYCIATIAPLFVSSKRHVWILGAALLLSVIATYIFYVDFFTSVWCFFGALLSMGIIALV